jgi:hypothetical protein
MSVEIKVAIGFNSGVIGWSSYILHHSDRS